MIPNRKKKEKIYMISEIEILDRQRMRNLEWYLISFVSFLFLTISRFFMRQSGLNAQPIGQLVLVALTITLLIQAFCAISIARLSRKIKNQPHLEEALNNELVRNFEIQSWKPAYFGAVGSTVFFAIVWFFYPVCDPVMIALTSIITGLGVYQATFYCKYKST